ncbi:hypothetical protein [Aegicerativicinus sediminis]|uniref:hypothetical protein n=1 Tax=Aegicerativicinus sediminis TaxID=2893202 RepID=UPI001E59A4F3|nr:hypothetical protein [Aegicerativicinus sediminis]
MKANAIKRWVIYPCLGILLSVCLINCSSDDSNNDNTLNEQLVQNTIGSNWIISNYIDSGQNETSDYSGYIFQFNSNGNVIAQKGDVTINGTWSITSEDDDSQDHMHFNLSFNVPEDHDFDDLIDDWHVMNFSNSRIDLEDDSSGSGDIDLLTFSKA